MTDSRDDNPLASADAMQQILTQAVDAVVSIDGANRVTFFNPAAERLWGYSAEEVVGQNVKMLVPPEMRADHDDMVDRNRTTGQDRIVGRTREVEIYRKDGSMIWGSLSLSKVRVGDTIMYTAFVRDITRDKQIRDGLVLEASQVMRGIAAGDLRHRVTGDYGRDLEPLKAAINDCAASLGGMVEDIRTAADSIDEHAREVHQGNDVLRSRTEEQASSLEETSASMEQMTQTVDSNANNSREVASLAEQAQTVATTGHQVVSQAVDAMTSISEASQEVNNIIGVIDEIAFQTNLLALNAAVEAARAGEMGRGFAVVATEVRNLAQRSAAAAKEIKSLIGSNMERVDSGTRLVNDSGANLQQIVDAVGKVSSIISEIAKASTEQADGIRMINRTVAQMDKITQETAGSADRTANASDELLRSASSLRNMVSHFIVDGSDTAARATAGEPLNPVLDYQRSA
jgi:methyl-accepting chemotaxis protein